MRIFTLKTFRGGKILWEGFVASSGMVMMAPTEPDVGLPTVFIDWAALERHCETDGSVFIAWSDIEVS